MDRLDAIQQRWEAIDRELADLADGKVIEGDPATREGELLAELDRLEYEAGEILYPRNRSD